MKYVLETIAEPELDMRQDVSAAHIVPGAGMVTGTKRRLDEPMFATSPQTVGQDGLALKRVNIPEHMGSCQLQHDKIGPVVRRILSETVPPLQTRIETGLDRNSRLGLRRNFHLVFREDRRSNDRLRSDSADDRPAPAQRLFITILQAEDIR